MNKNKKITNPLKRPIISWLITFVVVVIAFGALLPRLGSYSVVMEQIGSITLSEAWLLIALAILNVILHAWSVKISTKGLTLAQAYTAHTASTAVSNTLPGGGAISVGVSYAMYKSWSIKNTTIVQSVLVSGIFNTFVKLGTPVLALIALSINGNASSHLSSSALIGVGVLSVIAALLYGLLNSKSFTYYVGSSIEKLYDKLPSHHTYHHGIIPKKLQHFRISAKEMIAKRGLRLALVIIAIHTNVFFILLLSLRVIGIDADIVSWQVVLAGFAFSRLVTAAPITPGGLGVAEVSYVAALSLGVADEKQALIVSAVLLFRFFTFLLPIPLGFLSYLGWKSKH